VWQRVVFTGDGTSTRFYVNGVLTDTFGGSTAIAQATTVGQYTGSQGNAFWGDIDDVCFANRSWGAADALADYQDAMAGYQRTFLPSAWDLSVLSAVSSSLILFQRRMIGAQSRSL
jgi:hypothetical protein